jgi:putative endonuclease
MYYTYILTNKYNKVLYIGVTDDLQRRVEEHKAGANDGFTKQYNVDKLVYAETFQDIKYAIEREKQLKGWTHIKKAKLISKVNPDWDEILPF